MNRKCNIKLQQKEGFMQGSRPAEEPKPGMVIRGNQQLYQRSILSENIFLSWLNDTGLHTLLLKVKRLGVTE